MKLAILGATGASGRRLVRAALERGHHVTALVRNAGRLSEPPGDRLCVREVCARDVAALAGALRDHDVVISAAGHIGDGAGYVPLVEGVIRAAHSALGAGGRFWLFGGAALLDVPGTSITTLDLPGVPRVFEAHRANYHTVAATPLDWSMLCPGPMIDAPDGRASEGLVVSAGIWPVERPAFTRFLPRPALSLAFRTALGRLTIYYEDAARVILDNLDRDGALSRSRVGIALPNGERRVKPAVAARLAKPDAG